MSDEAAKLLSGGGASFGAAARLRKGCTAQEFYKLVNIVRGEIAKTVMRAWDATDKSWKSREERSGLGLCMGVVWGG